MTYVTSRSNFPTSDHWAIIRFTSIHIPGDERSRTHPGHGYPDRTETIINYQAFTHWEEWKAAVEELEKSYARDKYIAGYFTPATIERVIKISVPDEANKAADERARARARKNGAPDKLF